MSYEKQEEKTKGNDSHEVILEELANRINKFQEQRKFKEKLRDMKKTRVTADYNLQEYNAEESADYKQKAEGLITNLKTYFGNI